MKAYLLVIIILSISNVMYTDNEILFAYGNKNDNAEYITPHVDNYAIQKEINAVLSCGTSSNVHINISDEQIASRINFEEADWVLDSTTGLYKLELGAVNIFKSNLYR